MYNIYFPFCTQGGYRKGDPARGGRLNHPGVHTFVGSRSSSAEISFDSLGSDVGNEGHPSMNQFLGKYQRSDAIFKDALNITGELEGLWGGFLPIISYYFPRVAGGYIEFTAVPKPDMQGSMEQDAFFRVQRTAANGTVLNAKYFDNYAYTAGAFQSPSQVPASGEPPNSIVANDFFATLLEQRKWWEEELANEGILGLSVPSDTGTDGTRLHHMAIHGIIRDMITRRNTFHPKYGLATTSFP